MGETYDAPRAWSGEIQAPLILFRAETRPEWIDDFGHVNIAHYVTICDHATWGFWNWVNWPDSSLEAREGREYAVVETHLDLLDEIALGTPLHVTTQLIGHDAKRLILFHSIWKSETESLAATNEVKMLSFDLGSRRAAAWAPVVAGRLEEILRAHAPLGMPDRAGAAISLSRR